MPDPRFMDEETFYPAPDAKLDALITRLVRKAPPIFKRAAELADRSIRGHLELEGLGLYREAALEPCCFCGEHTQLYKPLCDDCKGKLPRSMRRQLDRDIGRAFNRTWQAVLAFFGDEK